MRAKLVVHAGRIWPTNRRFPTSCLVHKQMCHRQKLKFRKKEVDKHMLKNIHIFFQGFLFYVSELKWLDKFLISCDVVPSKHFHQKIRQHAIL